MTKSMLEKCLNKECVVFFKLDSDVQKAIKTTSGAEILVDVDRWERYNMTTHGHYNVRIVRLSPDTPTEPEYEEIEFDADDQIYGFEESHGVWLSASEWVSHKRFLGIIYTLNGVETMRTSVDAAFGTPVRVRFAKG